MERSYSNSSPVGRGGTAFGGIIIFAVAVAIFYVYLHYSAAIHLAPNDWMIETASGSSRAPGGGSHPLMFAIHYLIAYGGLRWIHFLPADSLDLSQKFISALGAAFFGGYLLQRFKSIMIALGGMMLLAFSFVYWRGALTLNPHQMAMMFFLAALCCVGEPSYGKEIVRLRDFVAALLLAMAVLCSQFFILFVPAFIYSSSERWDPRVHFFSVFLGLYLVASIGFFSFYMVGPPGLFAGTTFKAKVGEWFVFRPTEGSRLVLDTSASETAHDAGEKIARISTSGLESVLVGSYSPALALIIWFVIGLTAISILMLDPIRREGVLALLIVVPTIASIYLESNVGLERYLPLALGFALLASSVLGYFALSSSVFLSIFGPLLLFLLFAPSFTFINLMELKNPNSPAITAIIRNTRQFIP